MQALVTGGAGFLGRHLIERLLEQGHTVKTIDLPGPVLEELQDLGVDATSGDIRDADLIERLCRGMDIVFHPAALAAAWGSRELFWSINVTGTGNVISACKKAGVKRLVHVSSPSSVFDGTDHVMADESLPYPTRFISLYCETKAVSEQHALAASGPDLEIVAIRPHAMWGPGDRHLLPRVISRAKAGRLFQIGAGKNVISTLFIDNAVDALLLAAESEQAVGKVYFITNDQPVNLWDFVRQVLLRLDLPGPRGTIPFPVAYAIGAAYEAGWTVLRRKDEPMLTRYAVAELAKNHSYSIERAKADLGYKPRVSVEQGLERTIKWLTENDRLSAIN